MGRKVFVAVHKDVTQRTPPTPPPPRPPHAPPVLTSFVIYYWKTHRNLFDEWKWVLRYSFGPGKSSCFRERDSLLGFLYSFRTWDLAGESTLLPPAVPQKGTLIIIFCLFVFLTSSSSFIFHVKYHIRKNLNEIFLQEGQQEEIRG